MRPIKFGNASGTIFPTHDGAPLTLPGLDPDAQDILTTAIAQNQNPRGFTVSDTAEGFVIDEADRGDSVALLYPSPIGGYNLRKQRGVVYILRPFIPSPATAIQPNDILVIGDHAVQPFRSDPSNS